MGTARDLVRLEAALRDSREVDPFGPLDDGGLLEAPEVGAMLGRLRQLDLSDPLRVMRLCLQALRVQYESCAPRMIKAELVATLPVGIPGLARSTDQVLREMIRPPVKEVILLGYEVTDKHILRLLANAAAQGAKVIIICDRERGVAERVLESWPTSAPRPRVFQDRGLEAAAPYAKMHAKCLLVDGADLIVTSANFTFHGLHGNIEIGLRVHGGPAIEARKIFSYLVEKKIVEEKVC